MKIIGTGSYYPEYILTNKRLEELVETSDEWIKERTGIQERRISQGEGSSVLAINAAKNALDNAKIQPEELDMIILSTITPECYVPNMACLVQNAIGAYNALCIEMNAACTGFVYALHTANLYLESGMVKKALVIGVERLSEMIDYTDRTTCVLFGDGAGAVIVDNSSSSCYAAKLGSDSRKMKALYCKHPSLVNYMSKDNCQRDYLYMDGQEIFKFVLRIIPRNIKELLEQTNVDVSEIKYFVLHQANKRILEAVAKKLNVPEEKFPMNLDKYGNTSSASVPVLLHEMNEKNMLAKGDKIVLSAFGGGLTWGTIIIEW
ncbi:beta-ketoacyl-ACP synthase III [Anaeromicropila populeti]|uniref:Beta-ketoacyl-[acyl-carrier-protein] synthase III n=1 Tax=Anaeromicropila populeti TaxID=37658 RepID=A0A1I6LB24_9FIRM|nr:beta-ketoacyl-ACP synthase III [Anaeromicropila populeti]SFS00420.1 3-oxoacyl-[acyl-carrier-protein] synthase-3 [Anaeromicropila populeti]